MMTPFLHAKTHIHFLHLDRLPIFNQLQLEEALLRADDRNWCLLNLGSPEAIVMGISGLQEKLIDQKQILKKPIPVIRRFSGGGTVFVDLNTIFVTWICNTAAVAVPCCPKKVHEWAASFYQQAFSSIQMDFRENDYVIGDRKWGGNAQYLCKGRWLHHTSMLWDFNPTNMHYLLLPDKRPAYRQLRGHEDFLCRLCDYFPSQAELKKGIFDLLQHQFHVTEVSWDEVAPILQRPHRKATSLLTAL